MAQPFIGEIRLFGGNFAPEYWAFCNGQLLPIGEYDALFNLIGTTYGGDGQNTFALPDLQGRVPIHQGANQNGSFLMGAQGGVETVQLSSNQMPSHTHQVEATTAAGTSAGPGGKLLASGLPMYVSDAPNHTLNAASVQLTGSNQAHSNQQPYLCVSFIIALFGVYPSRN